ncbi:MAG: fibronectin type III domain-containing protein [Clostridium sp.]|nr:fibronectin type III domain-containing protein [Clostridium sp.]
MKKTLSALLSILMMLSILAGLCVPAYAEASSVYQAGSYQYSVMEDGTAMITRYDGNEKNIYIPDVLGSYKVTKIGPQAFGYNNNNNKYIQTVTIPGCITEIGEYAFYNCDNLRKVEMLYGVKTIGFRAFQSCNYLKEVTIPDSVTSLGAQVFDECTSLTNIVIPDSVTQIGESVFRGCSDLKNVKLSNSLISISSGMFSSCEKLTSVTGFKNVKHIGVQAFYNCKILKNVFLPAGITNIDYNTFFLCNNLTDVYFCGDQNSWSNVLIEAGNEKLAEAAVHFHKWNNSKITKAPTCLEKGIKTYTCDICKETKTEAIPVTEHNYTEKAVAPTCKNEGYILHTCSICKSYYKTDYVPTVNHSYKTTTKTTKATKSANGKVVTTYACKTCGYTYSKTTKTIYKPTTYTLSTSTYTYNGSAKKPSVTVKDSKGNKLKSGTDYTVSYPSGRKNVGKYTIKITFKGNYSGTATKSFTIKPKNTSLSSVSAGSKKFTVKWKKYTTQTTGYQIQYSTDKNFKKNNKTVTVSSSKTTSKTISKLSGKKKYYVRIRTYKTVNGTKYYSSWSSAKSVVTLK